MICTKCGVDRPATDYHVQNGKPKRTCKICCNARSKAYRDRDREKGKKQIVTKYGGSREMVSVPPWPPNVRVGAEITVELDVDLRERDAETATFSGVVIYLDKCKAILKGPRFKRTVERVDIHTRHCRVLG